jgi:hypothetical protein
MLIVRHESDHRLRADIRERSSAGPNAGAEVPALKAGTTVVPTQRRHRTRTRRKRAGSSFQLLRAESVTPRLSDQAARGVPRYTRRVDRSRLRLWVEDKRAVEARERAESRSSPLSGADAAAQALALVALYGRLHGWPPEEDAVSRREDMLMYERWHRLRLALTRG